jgi:signal transduction histidine kinase
VSVAPVMFVVAAACDGSWISSTWESIYGGSCAAFVGNPASMFDRVHGDDATAVRTQLATLDPQGFTRVHRGGGPVTVAARLRGARDRDRPVEITVEATGVGPNSRLVGSIRETDDVSVAFVSKMSHELRTPLHAILGYSQLLEMGIGDPVDQFQRVRRAGDHLVRLLDDLLDFSRVRAGELAVIDEVVDVAAVIDDVVDTVRGGMPAYVVQVRDVDASTRWVRADTTRLHQVLTNLVVNAVKYNRPSGTVALDTYARGDRVVVEITDTGWGIAPDRMDRLFVPFDRLGAEVSEVDGVGIGLALAQGLAHAMGASIEIESTLGTGTVARVVLRAANVATIG